MAILKNCPHCAGKKRVPCRACDGAGHIPCSVCNSTGGPIPSSRILRREQLVAECAEPGCGRRAVCLPTTEWHRKGPLMMRALNTLRIARRIGSLSSHAHLNVLRPRRMSTRRALKLLQVQTRAPWRLMCLRCLLLAYVRERGWGTKLFGFDFYGKRVFSRKLKRLRLRKNPEPAVDRLLGELEAEFLGWLGEVWLVNRSSRRRA